MTSRRLLPAIACAVLSKTGKADATYKKAAVALKETLGSSRAETIGCIKEHADFLRKRGRAPEASEYKQRIDTAGSGAAEPPRASSDRSGSAWQRSLETGKVDK